MGGEACSDHNECDIYHSCQANKVYPFDTTCQIYQKTGGYCDSDYDCPMDQICWYLNLANVNINLKTCMESFVLASAATSTFGWMGNASLTTLENSL